jgi:hypothetical protein
LNISWKDTCQFSVTFLQFFAGLFELGLAKEAEWDKERAPNLKLSDHADDDDEEENEETTDQDKEDDDKEEQEQKVTQQLEPSGTGLQGMNNTNISVSDAASEDDGEGSEQEGGQEGEKRRS